MPESSNLLVKFTFFQGALPEAVFWGRIALGVGIAGAVASLLLILAHLRDRISLKRGWERPEEYRAPQWGPLSSCLGEFFADPMHNAPLSPDAASEFVAGRLDAHQDLIQSAIRYFSYAPLLLGLMGTTLALRALLVTGGYTLQEIQPQLGGVFAGTLAGISGSLLAAVAGLLLDRVALSSANRAQDFIHRFILPTLPERRIAIRIEDAVLALIGERAQAVAESFRNALQPVVTEMEDVAVRCGKAAEAATNAFSEAARAVREAGNLEAASRNFKSGAHMIDSSAEQLSDATKQTAEIVLRVGEVRASLASLVDRLRETSENLGAASEHVGTQLTSQLAALSTQGASVERCVGDLRAAVDTLSNELIRRSNADSALIEAIQSYAELNERTLAGLMHVVRESSDGVKLLHANLDSRQEKTLEQIRVELAARLGESTQRTLSVLETLKRGDGAALIELTPGISVALREAVTEVRTVSDESRRLLAEVKRVHSVPTSESNPAKPGFLRRFWN